MICKSSRKLCQLHTLALRLTFLDKAEELELLLTLSRYSGESGLGRSIYREVARGRPCMPDDMRCLHPGDVGLVNFW